MNISIVPTFKYNISDQFIAESKNKIHKQFNGLPISKSSKIRFILSDQKQPKNSKSKNFLCKVLFSDFESGTSLVVSKKSTRLPVAISKAMKVLANKFKKESSKQRNVKSLNNSIRKWKSVELAS